MRRYLIRQLLGRASLGQSAQAKYHSEHAAFATSAPLTVLGADEQQLQESVRKLTHTAILPHRQQMDRDACFRPDVLAALRNAGLMGINIATEYGGSGCPFHHITVAVEQLSHCDPAVAALVHIHNCLVNNLLMKVGSAEQKREYLPRLAAEYAGSFALSETAAGSDAFALRTTARWDGNCYVLDGSKQWISQADIAGVFIVMATVDAAAGRHGISAFLVERDAPGVCVGPLDDKLGIRALGTCAVHLNGVRVSRAALLGELGQGYRYAASFVNEARIGIGAQMVGLAQGCLDATVPYLLERQQFGRALFDNQAMEHDVARVRTQIEAARLLVYNASKLVDAGLPFVREAAMCKWFALDVAQRTTSQCIDWMGGLGFTRGAWPQEKFYRDCKVGAIYGGTTNMQLGTIAQTLRKEYAE